MINTYVDDVMRLLLKELNIPCPPYNPACDPTRQPLPQSELWQEEFTKKEWTLGPRIVNTTRKRLAVHLEHSNNAKKPKATPKSDKKPDVDPQVVVEDLIKREPIEDVTRKDTEEEENKSQVASDEKPLKCEQLPGSANGSITITPSPTA